MKIQGVDSRSMASAKYGRIDFKVVLVQHDETIPFVMAYRGEGPIEYVALYGDRLSIHEAKPHFPSIERVLTQNNFEYGEP
jgi:hypothetical protein